MNYNPLAQALNAELSANGCKVLDMLSEQGKAIFFPRRGPKPRAPISTLRSVPPSKTMAARWCWIAFSSP